MHLNKEAIAQTERKRRLNIINSISGIKPANLIGTISESGQTNLAIFSSVVHLGSDPALLGFMIRPTGEVPRHTYENILETGVYTINAIPATLSKKAHYTSAKFHRSVSEFERCAIAREFIAHFRAPFVQESPIKIGLQFLEELPVKQNGTSLIIGSVEQLIIADELVAANGYIDFEQANLAGVGGLNAYYKLSLLDTYPYAREEEVPRFDE